MKLTWRTEWPHWLVLVVMFALAGLAWGSAPDRIPVHWGLDGKVDGYGGKLHGLLLLPLVSLALYFALLWLPRLDPGRANYPAFAGAYATIRLATLVVLAVTYDLVLLQVEGRDVRFDTVMPLVAGAMCVVLGGVLGKLRPNWFVGIRTPWTLSSKQAWTRTHRAAGWLSIVLGVATMGAAMLGAEWALWALGIGAGVGALGLAAYSYRVWRDDPEKLPPAGTLPAENG